MRKTAVVIFVLFAVLVLLANPCIAPVNGATGIDTARTAVNAGSSTISSDAVSAAKSRAVPAGSGSSAGAGAPPLPNGVTTPFAWWNTSWHYRIRLDVNASTLARLNVTVPTWVNMTYWLKSAGISETVDVNSPRVVEQNATTGAVIVEQPSVFFKDANWNAASNATGWLLFFLNGSMPAKRVRTVLVYFDTLQKGTKTAPNYAQVVAGWFSQYYSNTGGSYSLPSPTLFVSKYLATTCNQVSYHDGSGNNFPAGADGPSPDWDYFSGNYTTWLFVPKGASYGFQTGSDDGSWLYVDDQLVVNNGGLHGYATVSGTKSLAAGLHSIKGPWYEQGGAAAIDIRWNPGSGYVLLTSANVTCIKFGTLMNMTTPCIFTWGTTMGIFLLRAHVRDVDNSNIVAARVRLINATNPTQVFATGYTDANGNYTFNVIRAGNYRVEANFTTIYPTGVAAKISLTPTWNVALNATVEGKLLDHTFVIPVATITYTVKDLGGAVMGTSGETTTIFVTNSTYRLRTPEFLAYQDTNATGKVTFTRIPTGTYNFTFAYTNLAQPTVYTWLLMRTFAKTRNETSVTSGFSQSMILPLCHLTTNVTSYNRQRVPDVFFDIASNTYTGISTTGYSKTSSEGMFTFNHILNGSWAITSYRSDTYGQSTINTTTASFATTFYTAGSPFQINFPLDNLRVRVQDHPLNNPLSGATVSVYLPGGASLVTQGSTDKNGEVVFTWIKNGTYWLNASIYATSANYTLNLGYGVNLRNIKPNYTTWTPIRIYVQFGPKDCVFYLENATIVYVYYGTNFTLRFRFVNQTGTVIVPMDATIARWVNFTLTHSGFSTIAGTWNASGSYNVFYAGNGYWYVTVNVTQFAMNVSGEPYVVSINGYAVNGTTAFNAPQTLVVRIYIQTTPTGLTNPGPQVVTWGPLISFQVTYTDTNHSLALTGATVAYQITGAFTRSGVLVGAGPGVYAFSHWPVAGDLNLPAGSYTITVTAQLANYQTRVVVVALTINAVSTAGSVNYPVVALNWSRSFLFAVNYSYAVNGTSITIASVYVMWAGTPVYLTYNAGTSLYEGTFFGNTWSVGAHLNVAVVASLGNHTTQNLSFDVTIAQTPTGSSTPPNYPSQGWGATRRFLFAYTDLNSSSLITAAQITLNWTQGYWSVVANGNGTYTVSLDMSVAPGNYVVGLTATKAGFASQNKAFSVGLLIPLQVQSTTGWVTIYWTRNFSLSVLVLNGYSVTNESGVTVTWAWSTNSGSFSWLADVYTSTSRILASMFGVPGNYIIEINATKTGATTAKGYIYVTVNANPTTLEPDSTTPRDVYYGENSTIRIFWRDTFEGVGVGSAAVNASVYYGATRIGSGFVVNLGGGNYSIVIRSALLGMIAGQPYLVRVVFTRNGYVQATSMDFIVTCRARPTTLTITILPLSIEQGATSVDIWAEFTDNLVHSRVTGATVTCTIVGVTGALPMTLNLDGRYHCQVDARALAFGAYQVRVDATLANYVSGQSSTILQVIERGINLGPIRITFSQLLFAAAGIAIVVVAFAAYVGYKRATIPYQLKCLNKAIKAMNKGRPADMHPGLMNREQQIKKLLKERYKQAGVNIQEPESAG
jgi:hypothetical protein